MYNDSEYINIISNILENKKFSNTKNCKHHGISRFEHSLRVSYYSYKITKKLKLSYIETARAGLLHDFFITDELKGKSKKFRLIIHPYKALENAKKYFILNEKEEDIIINHMFPTLPHKIPKFLESWIVSMVDKGAAVYEFWYSISRRFKFKFENAMILALFFLNRF